MKLKNTAITTLAAIAVAALVLLTSPTVAPAAAVTSAATKTAELKVEQFTMADYVLGPRWESKGGDALYHLNISVDGSAYKTVDSWGEYNEASFTMASVNEYFPKAAKNFKGNVVVSYEINGKSIAESTPRSFSGDPKNFNSIRWN